MLLADGDGLYPEAQQTQQPVAGAVTSAAEHDACIYRFVAFAVSVNFLSFYSSAHPVNGTRSSIFLCCLSVSASVCTCTCGRRHSLIRLPSTSSLCVAVTERAYWC